MPLLVNQVLMQWRDKNGKSSTNFMTTLDQAAGGASTYAALGAAMQDCSDALLEAIQFQTTVILTGIPGTGDYPTVWDRAVMLANVTTTNQPTRVEIPAPKSSILQADNTLVNLESAEIIALETQCMTFLGDAAGHAMGPFKRGIRQNAR